MDKEDMIFKQLTLAISALTSELALAREERSRNLVTKHDLKETEFRLIAAIQVSESEQHALNELLKRANRIAIRVTKLALRLKRLDDSTP